MLDNVLAMIAAIPGIYGFICWIRRTLKAQNEARRIKRIQSCASQSLFIGAMLFLGSLVCTANEIKLESGSTLTLSDTEYSRFLPHVFYDQALSSLPHLFPDHDFLAGRRSGTLGEVAYALVCFKETRSSEQVRIQGTAVHRKQAWYFETVTASASYGETLMQVLEQIEKLSSDPGGQQTLNVIQGGINR